MILPRLSLVSMYSASPTTAASTMAKVLVNPKGIIAKGINNTGITATAIAIAHTVPDSRVSNDFLSIYKIYYYCNFSHTINNPIIPPLKRWYLLFLKLPVSF